MAIKKSLTTSSKFSVKKAQLEILERFSKVLDEMNNDATTDYRVVGKEEEQATNWKTGELLWEDEECTIPRYRDKWDSVVLKEDEMTEDKRAMVLAISHMRAELDKMI